MPLTPVHPRPAPCAAHTPQGTPLPSFQHYNFTSSDAEETAYLQGRVSYPWGQALIASFLVIAACISLGIFVPAIPLWVLIVGGLVLLGTIWSITYACGTPEGAQDDPVSAADPAPPACGTPEADSASPAGAPPSADAALPQEAKGETASAAGAALPEGASPPEEPNWTMQKQQVYNEFLPQLKSLYPAVGDDNSFQTFLTAIHTASAAEGLSHNDVRNILETALAEIIPEGTPETPFEVDLGRELNAYQAQHPQAQRRVPPPPQRPSGFITPALIGLAPGISEGPQGLDAKEIQRRIEVLQAQIVAHFPDNPKNYPELVETLHNREVSGLSDQTIDVIIQAALQDLREENDSNDVDSFAKALQIEVNKFRYLRLVKVINDYDLVQMRPLDAVRDGDCFLHATMLGLAHITGEQQTPYTKLRASMVEEFDRAMSDPDPTLREKFLFSQIAGQLGVGNMYNKLEEWETTLLGNYRNNPQAILEASALDLARQIEEASARPSSGYTSYAALAKKLQQDVRDIDTYKLDPWAEQREEPWEAALLAELGYPYIQAEDNADALLDQMRAKGVEGSDEELREIRDRFKLRMQANLKWESALFIRLGYGFIQNEGNADALLDQMRAKGVRGSDEELIEKRDRFKRRLYAIFDGYRNGSRGRGGLIHSRTENSFFETELAARVLRRTIVTLESNGRGGWVSHGAIAGQEFLPPLNRLAKYPPITLLHNGAHYEGGLYLEAQ